MKGPQNYQFIHFKIIGSNTINLNKSQVAGECSKIDETADTINSRFIGKLCFKY